MAFRESIRQLSTSWEIRLDLPWPPSEEHWRDVLGYEGMYQVSSLGRVRSLDRLEVMPYRDTTRTRRRKARLIALRLTNGYYQVGFSKNGAKWQPLVHRLVAEAFIQNPEHKPQVNHIDGNKTNNVAENLEWCTCMENVKHAIDVLGIDKSGGKQHSSKSLLAKNGSHTMQFRSIREAERAGFVRHMIQSCLKGKYSQHRGYTWELKQSA